MTQARLFATWSARKDTERPEQINSQRLESVLFPNVLTQKDLQVRLNSRSMLLCNPLLVVNSGAIVAACNGASKPTSPRCSLWRLRS
jgi:hypothetical protein